MQTGSYFDRRVAIDAGQAINENVAARLKPSTRRATRSAITASSSATASIRQ